MLIFRDVREFQQFNVPKLHERVIRMEDHFDAALGGSERVPTYIATEKFAQARCQEIVALNNALEQAQKGGLIFQRLPKAMRRRVMAHHSKRMPRRLREAHTKQLEKNGVPLKTKCPSRKYRRRPQNLLLEYNRRQRNFVWLETHIWHAKRFHMTEKWGYKLANIPNAKCFRACYRACANHCLLQDISYYCCIEMSGPPNELIQGLNVHVSNTVGLTFGAQAFLTGCKEGHVTFFHQEMFPFGAIGKVKFLWKAEEDEHKANQRTLWLWTHPALYTEVTNCLLETLALSEELPLEGSSKPVNSQFSVVETKKLETHRVFDALPKYVNSAKTIYVTLLKDKLNRFRLTGPLSHSVLVDTLNVTSVSHEPKMPDILESEDIEIVGSDSEIEDPANGSKKQQEADVNDNKRISCNSKPWWRSYYKSDENSQKAHCTQSNFWQSMKGTYSPAQLPPHQIVALTVLDPRYQLPSKRTKVVPDYSVLPKSDVYTNLPNSISLSPIWSSDVRAMASTSKLSNSEWEKHRKSRILVPGFSEGEINSAKNLNLRSTDAFEQSYIPVLLVQRPGSQDPTTKRLGFSSGWDIIVPAGWGMSFWMALIFRGAKPGGLKETSMLGLEAGAVEFSELFAPDTAAGKVDAEANRQQREDQYFRSPPNKRPNFIKLGIASPFSCCWNSLMNDWCQNKQKDLNTSFYVLRDKVKLDALKCIINSYKTGNNVNGNTRADQISQFSSLFSNMNHNCLIPVRIESVKRGCPVDCALICIPSSEDLTHLKENSSFEGPIEPIHCDNKTDERKGLRTRHQKELKRLRRQRVRSNDKLKKQMDMLLEKGESISHLVSIKKDKMPTKDIVDKYAEEMKLLWVPEVTTIKDSCSRSVVGFVCKGDFSLSEASGIGLGYIPLPAIIHLISTWTDKPIVLFRNPNTLQYRYAFLKVC